MKNPLQNFRLALAMVGIRFRAIQALVLILFLLATTLLLSGCKTTCPAYHTIDKKSTLFSKQEAKLEVDSLIELSLK